MKHYTQGILTILNRQEKIKLARVILADLVMGVLDIAFLGFTLVVINFYTQGAGSASSSFIPNIFTDKNSLLLISTFFLLFCLKNWLGYIGSKQQHHFFYNVASRLSKRNIQHYLKDDYTRFVDIDSSVLIHKISQQPIEFSHYMLTNFQQVVSQGILILFTVIAILFYHPTLFLILFILLTPPVILLGYAIRKKLKGVRASTKTASQKTLQHLHESLSGYVESNIYNKDDFFVDRYYAQQQQLNNNIATQQTLQGLSTRLIEVFAILGFFILVLINKLSGGASTVSVLTIGVFMAAAYKIIPGIVKILNSTGQMKTYEFTLTDLAQVDNATPIKRSALSASVTQIRFDEVKFSYKNRRVLNGVNFEISKGEFIGISAHSGKGKTTIVNLLLGFLKPESGSISINYKHVNETERQAYRSKISYVKQQPFVINDTIIKNITLSDDEPDHDKLVEAIRFCGIDNMVAQYSEGLNKTISENGKNISGGQRQRIMLARALYHDFDLLILDEAFGEMDQAAEKDILKKLQELALHDKMIILITHNKASLNYCNKIVILDTQYA